MATPNTGAAALIRASMTKLSPFLPVDEVAMIIGRSKTTVYRMIREGQLEAVPCPKRPKVTRRSLRLST